MKHVLNLSRVRPHNQSSKDSFRLAAFFTCGYSRELCCVKLRKFHISAETQLSASAGCRKCSPFE